MEAYRLMVKRADERITIAIFGCSHGCLGLEHGVDATN